MLKQAYYLSDMVSPYQVPKKHRYSSNLEDN